MCSAKKLKLDGGCEVKKKTNSVGDKNVSYIVRNVICVCRHVLWGYETTLKLCCIEWQEEKDPAYSLTEERSDAGGGGIIYGRFFNF